LGNLCRMTYGYGDDRDDWRTPAQTPPGPQPRRDTSAARAARIDPPDQRPEPWQAPPARRPAGEGYPPAQYPPEQYPPEQYPAAQYPPEQYPPAQYPPADPYQTEGGYPPEPYYPASGPGYAPSSGAGYAPPVSTGYQASPGYGSRGGYPQEHTGYQTGGGRRRRDERDDPYPGRPPAPNAYESNYGYDAESLAPGYDPFEATGPQPYQPEAYAPPQHQRPDPYAQAPRSAPPYGRPEPGSYGRPPSTTGGYTRPPESGVYGRPGQHTAYGRPVDVDPYARPAQPEPYGRPDPYSGRPDQTDPYGGRAPQSDPYGGRAPQSDPYGGRAPQSDPYGGRVRPYVPDQRGPNVAEAPPRRRTWADEQPSDANRTDHGTGSVRRIATAGPGRPGTPPTEPKPGGRNRVLLAAIVAVVVLAGAGTAAILLLHHGTSSSPPAVPSHSPINDQAIADQLVDSKPLTAAEVFQDAIKSSAPGGGVYQVAGSQAASGCDIAVTDALATLVKSSGCTQVVRATMTSPDGAYVITAGIFNLRDRAAANQAFSAVKVDVDGGKGRFTGLATGGPTDVITQAQANLAWDTRGHYLIYSVIALSDGKAISSSDPRTGLIVTDVVENYLGDHVLGARAAQAATATHS
jgi:hypothetical protein